LYRGDQDRHYYTTNSHEAFELTSPENGWTGEGHACYVYETPQPNTTDFFRRYNPSSPEHFYTIDPAEAQNVLSFGFTDEKTACHVYTVGDPNAGIVPFYRLVK
jgi:hypothetical protein